MLGKKVKKACTDITQNLKTQKRIKELKSHISNKDAEFLKVVADGDTKMYHDLLSMHFTVLYPDTNNDNKVPVKVKRKGAE